MNDWIAAGIAVAAGLVLGSIAARVTQAVLGREGRPDIVRGVASPMGSLVFSLLLIAGLMTGLGFVQPDALDQIPEDLVDYLPKLLSAAIVLLGANVVGQLTGTALDRATGRMTGAAARNVPRITRLTITTFGAILAAAQLGVDTTVINLAVAAVLFSLGLAAALMIGLGSRTVAGGVAAGRAVKRMVAVGDRVELDDIRGTVAAIGSVSIEIDQGDGTSMLVPNSRLLETNVLLARGDVDDVDDPDG